MLRNHQSFDQINWVFAIISLIGPFLNTINHVFRYPQFKLHAFYKS